MAPSFLFFFSSRHLCYFLRKLKKTENKFTKCNNHPLTPPTDQKILLKENRLSEAQELTARVRRGRGQYERKIKFEKKGQSKTFTPPGPLTWTYFFGFTLLLAIYSVQITPFRARRRKIYQIRNFVLFKTVLDVVNARGKGSEMRSLFRIIAIRVLTNGLKATTIDQTRNAFFFNNFISFKTIFGAFCATPPLVG